ncbi:MAG TPA: hypothetical protein VMZ74_14885 [Ramlibacter sp.]|nr:hypothetical protein [Ramlibacter sp.]
MLVHRADITDTERADFERAIRACGKDPRCFTAELFEATLVDSGATLRRVHVRQVGSCAAAQYEASGTVSWTSKFALHLAVGRFG